MARSSGVTAAAPATRPRGRPRKNGTAAAPGPVPVAATIPRKRGRPRKTVKAPRPVAQPVEPSRVSPRSGPKSKQAEVVEAEVPDTPRRSGRVKAVSTPQATPQITKTALRKGRGRPKGAAAATQPAPSRVNVETQEKAKGAEALVPARGRGRPRKNALPQGSAPTAIAKRPRAKRGFTTIEVPKKFLSQVQQLVLQLEADDDENKDEELADPKRIEDQIGNQEAEQELIEVAEEIIVDTEAELQAAVQALAAADEDVSNAEEVAEESEQDGDVIADESVVISEIVADDGDIPDNPAQRSTGSMNGFLEQGSTVDTPLAPVATAAVPSLISASLAVTG